MPIIIIDYSSEWPQFFERLKAPLLNALGEMIVAVEHVGSTAVPGLAAKPVIDLDVVVESQNVPAAIAALATLGYIHQGDLGISGREAFQSIDNGIDHHLYLVTPDSRELQRHLVFRDYLRTHPAEVRAYADLKRHSARVHVSDRAAYTHSKTKMIEKMLHEAMKSSLNK